MGLYKRGDHANWWMKKLPALKGQDTGVPRLAGGTAEQQKTQREAAEGVLNATLTRIAQEKAGLAKKELPAITFDKWADWWERHKLPLHKPSSQEGDRQRLKHLRRHFGAVALSAIDEQAASEYETARLNAKVGPALLCCGLPVTGRHCGACRKRVIDARRTVNPNTINREVAVLKIMLRDACPRYLGASPLKGRKNLRVVETQGRVLDAAEVARVADALSPAYRAIFLLCVETLMRLSSALDLTRDVDKGDHLALKDSKTGPYTVPLSPRLRALLDALPNEGPYFFAPLRQAKNPRDRSGGVRLALRRACKKAGVPYGRMQGGVTFHTGTRATGATLQLRMGADLRTVMDNGHWDDMRSVQRYLHSNQETRRQASDVVGDAVDAARIKAPMTLVRKDGRRIKR